MNGNVEHQGVRQQADRLDELVAAAERYMLAVKKLGEDSGLVGQTFFECSIASSPTEIAEAAYVRWMELDEAGRSLARAISVVRAGASSEP